MALGKPIKAVRQRVHTDALILIEFLKYVELHVKVVKLIPRILLKELEKMLSTIFRIFS